MFTFLKPPMLLISLLILMVQGCGNSNSSSTYPTALGDGSSVTTTDENAVMLPNTNTLKNIGQEVATIIATDLSKLNNKEATEFTKETNYCNISGLSELENKGTYSKITSIKTYSNCKEENHTQNGDIEVNYEAMNSEGKYPKTHTLTATSNYTFNNTELKKDLKVESNITYNTDKNVEQITVKINGKLKYDNMNYELQNIRQSVNY